MKFTIWRRIGMIALALIAAIGLSVAATAPAEASAQTCISASGGYVCTIVSGSGTYVSSVGMSRGKDGSICNYNAWFYYVPPTGGAYSLGYQSRAGCTYGRAWFNQAVNRSFPRNTLVCGKWHENSTDFIGEKCVGVS